MFESQKVSCRGQELSLIVVEELLPFAHLFHELHFHKGSHHASLDVLRRCVNIRKFVYRGYNGRAAGAAFVHSVIAAVATSCPLLVDLDLGLNSMDVVIADTIFLDLHHNCTLRKLFLTFCHLSVSSLRSIADMGSLRVLTIVGCNGLTNAGIFELARMHLVELSITSIPLNDVYNVSEACLASFAGANISRCLLNWTVSSVSY